MAYYFVYRITNVANGKVYIGKTSNVKRRWVEHLAKSRAGCPRHLTRAIRKYGVDKFEITVLSQHTDEEAAYAEEVRQIREHDARNKLRGYNLTSGGEGVRGLSDEGRSRLRAFAKKRVGKRNAFFGRHHTEETKARMASVPRPSGSKHPMWGRHHSDEAKEKIRRSKLHTDWRMPEEQRQAVSTRHAGERSSTAKVTNLQAAEIRGKRASGALIPQLMQEYALSRSSVYKIISGATFRGAQP